MPYSVKGEGNAEPQIRERRVTEMGPALPIALHAANGGNLRRGDSAFHNRAGRSPTSGHSMASHTPAHERRPPSGRFVPPAAQVSLADTLRLPSSSGDGTRIRLAGSAGWAPLP